MFSFADAAEKATETGLPVPEGFAVKLRDENDANARDAVARHLNTELPGYGWEPQPGSIQGWVQYHAAAPAPGSSPPALKDAWDAVRTLRDLPPVERAELLLLTRTPFETGSEAQQAFRLWGRISNARLKQIKQASDENHKQWSLEAMRVCETPDTEGAWAVWRAKHPGKEPGEGILIAHPDTGYTDHPGLVPHLAGAVGNCGRNFVERDAQGNPTDDALDPMTERGLGHFPGHGTSTGSAIVADISDNKAEPWGIVPGAELLPLRVSTSVVHWSFRNVSEALLEAVNRDAHVVSMSLGGAIGSELLDTVVRHALDNGIILVSAAGNYAPSVVFPACLPGVIACSASNVLDAPWRFSGMGNEVVITAPGEEVWHYGKHFDAAGNPKNADFPGTGTSFAAANVAGLAALWLSYHGRDNLIQNHCGNDKRLLPFLFRLCLQNSSVKTPRFIKGGKGGFGEGIANAEKLLRDPFPSVDDVVAERNRVLSSEPGRIADFPVNTWWNIATLPTLTADGSTAVLPAEQAKERSKRINEIIEEVVGPRCNDDDKAEIRVLVSSDTGLQLVLDRVGRSERGCASPDALRRYLLRAEASLSRTLTEKLDEQKTARQAVWRAEKFPGLGRDGAAAPVPAAIPTPVSGPYSIAPPTPKIRRLRAFAFDPGLATQVETAAINEITIPVVFEPDLLPGPVGEYLEVVDVDPASDCAYAPVDLNHPYMLAGDGLAPSEGNPQFHQQMVYAVGMKTIQHFEEALGRPVFWSSLRPWDRESDDKDRAAPAPNKNDQFVQRLRVYPHALRGENAYYSPQKRAILFGYFPAGDADPGAAQPGGMVFSCLSHDIIAHEMTHAILDGMHVRFTEPTNPDVYAFHEAFADIVALFQHFTYPETLRDQIGRARGDLGTGTLLTQLAMQFGRATGKHHALRDALGASVLQRRTRGTNEWRDRRDDWEIADDGETPGPEATIRDAARSLGSEDSRRVWQRYSPDPTLLDLIEEPHERGSLLVAAVFDAFLSIYESRIADLKRIATGGTGVLPNGRLHPDLVERMAREAAKSAGHVLRICIRAMDYVPPIDITFGEFLRALITADYDLVPDDPRRYRVAFIDAFRKWGIYPRDVRTLSEETLRWSGPENPIKLFPDDEEEAVNSEKDIRQLTRLMRRSLLAWDPGRQRSKKKSESEPEPENDSPRASIFRHSLNAQGELNNYLWHLFSSPNNTDDEKKRARALFTGLEENGNRFSVANLRPARRVGPNGEFFTELVFEIIQRKREEDTPEAGRRKIPFRGGVTLIVSMDDWRIRYMIRKNIDSERRQSRQSEYTLRVAGGGKAAEYSSQAPPDLERDKARWSKDRVTERESMRISSFNCREGRRKAAAAASNNQGGQGFLPLADDDLVEPFAFLHRR